MRSGRSRDPCGTTFGRRSGTSIRFRLLLRRSQLLISRLRDRGKMAYIFEEIKKRCEAAGIDYEEIEGEWSVLREKVGEQEIIKYIDEEVGSIGHLRIDIPRGRGTFPVYVQAGPYVEWITYLDELFEDSKKLKGYEASWSVKHRVIECNLVPCDPDRAALSLSKRRYTNPGDQPASSSEERVVFESSAPYSISIGECSNGQCLESCGFGFPSTSRASIVR